MREHMREPVQKVLNLPRPCPNCGAVNHLYRTPRGLRCARCVKILDSSGLGFGSIVRNH